MKVMDHRCLIQMCQFSHVICLVKFGRVDLVDLVGIHFSLLFEYVSCPQFRHLSASIVLPRHRRFEQVAGYLLALPTQGLG